MSNVSINPATEEEIARYEHISDADLSERLERSWKSFVNHRDEGFAPRALRIRKCADLLDARAREYGELITREMGKPLSQAVAEVEKCALVCRYYADQAADQLKDQIIHTEADRSLVTFQPLGPVLAVMPWNFPFWQVFRFAAPALMAGNTALLKHASNVTGAALAIEEVFRDAGFDDDQFQTLIVESSRVEGIISDDRVRAVTLTGSERAGKAVASAAAREIKPSVLELGSSDPFIVLNDADLGRAVPLAVKARMQNNGQSCIAAKRFIVEAGVYDRFVERFVEEVEGLSVGDPMDESVDVGPIARADLRQELEDQVRRSVADGATIAAGGRALDRKGYFYEPTVLVDVEQGTVAFSEEIFGPVAAVTRARDVDHAIDLANATPFGLGGAVFTSDIALGESVARRLEAGTAFVNSMVKSDPKIPFGGIKRSGYGRELSEFGIREFVNVKSIWIES